MRKPNRSAAARAWPTMRRRVERFAVTDVLPVVSLESAVDAAVTDNRDSFCAAIADEKQVSQHFDAVALLAVAQQLRHRHAERLPHEIEKCRLDGRERVDHHPLVKRLHCRGRPHPARANRAAIVCSTSFISPTRRPTTNSLARLERLRESLRRPGVSPTPV